MICVQRGNGDLLGEESNKGRGRVIYKFFRKVHGGGGDSGHSPGKRSWLDKSSMTVSPRWYEQKPALLHSLCSMLPGDTHKPLHKYYLFQEGLDVLQTR